ncbi:MAG: ATP synthase F1 subunit gamma [Candidatus Bipolaricaulota bacterium]|nr:ATP synthase F1 subunit gamma [Candidatus Bipolaricaulota bacterium]
MSARVRQIRRRIGNVRHVRQITKAMYTIAATQVVRRKRALLSARPFTEAAGEILAGVAAAARREGLVHPLLKGTGRPGTAILVVNADRGLCGPYVGDVNRAAVALAREKAPAVILAGGEKARLHFRRGPWTVTHAYVHALDHPSLETAQGIAADLLALYGTEAGEAYAVYTYFRGELAQVVRTERLLPFDLPPGGARDLLIEPDLPRVVDALGRLYLAGRVLRILLEAKASEHALRRQAMKAATDNADELLEKLTLAYNKARQHRITAELADIMGGAEALREEG